jgi:hypothetical protein
MSSGGSELERQASPSFQEPTGGKLARAHLERILSVSADQRELLATARAVKGLAFEI